MKPVPEKAAWWEGNKYNVALSAGLFAGSLTRLLRAYLKRSA